MRARPGAVRRAPGSRFRQTSHTLAIESTESAVSSYQFIVHGTASIQNEPTFGDFVTGIGDYTVVSGFVHGGMDVWSIEGEVVSFKIQENRTGSYVLRLDDVEVSAGEIVGLTGGDQFDLENPGFDGGNGGNGNGNGGGNGNGSNGNGGNGNGEQPLPGGLTTLQIVGMLIIAGIAIIW